jgi:hemerythrin-like domain-containing protein
LEKTRMIRAAIDEPESGAAHAVAEDLVTYWNEEGRFHFHEEEQVLRHLVARAGAKDPDGLAARLLSDLAWFRHAFAELSRRVFDGDSCREQLATMADRLVEHARLEDESLFARIRADLSPSESQAIRDQAAIYRQTAVGA